jgi:hypothetical protein
MCFSTDFAWGRTMSSMVSEGPRFVFTNLDSHTQLQICMILSGLYSSFAPSTWYDEAAPRRAKINIVGHQVGPQMVCSSEMWFMVADQTAAWKMVAPSTIMHALGEAPCNGRGVSGEMTLRYGRGAQKDSRALNWTSRAWRSPTGVFQEWPVAGSNRRRSRLWL